MKTQPKNIFVLAESSLTEIPSILKDQSPKWLKLLDSTYHYRYIEKNIEKEKEKYGRPDIVHRALLTILDSPIIKENDFEIYIHTLDDKVIKIYKETRIPRHYIRFIALFGQILQEKKTIETKNGQTLIEYLGEKPLLKIINEIKGKKGYVIGYSRKGKQINLRAILKNIIDMKRNPIIHVVGGFSKGTFRKETEKAFDEKIALTKYSLSTSATICRIMATLEEIYNEKRVQKGKMK